MKNPKRKAAKLTTVNYPRAAATRARRAPLPRMFRGAVVVRGLGMDGDKYARLIEEKAAANFDATRDMWVVLDDKALEADLSVTLRAFSDKADALRCARANGNGNVDQRVLRVTEQILVVATENDL